MFKAWRWTGELFKRCEHLPLTDRGFRYGMSVFESFRVERGSPAFWDAHVLRLRSACADRSFPIDDTVFAAAGRILARRSVDGWARIYVTAGDGGPASEASAPRVFILLEPRAAPLPESYDVTISDEEYRAPFGGLKTGNYWFNADVLAAARSRKFDEALLFNGFAELVSACMANVFVVRDGEISTPSRSSGARAGVIREWVMARRKVQERRLRREDVVNADEIFLTNSWLGVMPVSTVEGRPLGQRVIGPKLSMELEKRRR